jgi:hypothetical protein
MYAGTLAKFENALEEPLEDHATGGFATLDVKETQRDLAGDSIAQSGRAEEVPSTKRVWTEWAADPTGSGVIAAERTAGANPGFPFDVFRSVGEQLVDPLVIDPGALIQSQAARDRAVDVWMTGDKAESGSALTPDDVQINYGREATVRDAQEATVGVGFEIPWEGKTVRGVAYQSGYVAVFTDGVGPTQYIQFISDVILPHAEAPDPEGTEEQTTLEGGESA